MWIDAKVVVRGTLRFRDSVYFRSFGVRHTTWLSAGIEQTSAVAKNCSIHCLCPHKSLDNLCVCAYIPGYVVV